MQLRGHQNLTNLKSSICNVLSDLWNKLRSTFKSFRDLYTHKFELRYLAEIKREKPININSPASDV